MRISIVIAVLNSQEIVRRQLLHFSKMDLPKDIEFVFVDDGSDPEINFGADVPNMSVIRTLDKRPWTQGIARNLGAKNATGEYLLFTDIDHILSKEAIMDAYNYGGDKMIFPRYFGVLLEDGTLSQDLDVLEKYGLDPMVAKSKRGLYASVHGNTYSIKRSTFNEIGGYDEKHCLYGHHAPARQGEDSIFNARWNHLAVKKNLQWTQGSKIYMFPIGRFHKNGDTNPLGLFHGLSYAQP